jgi:hypothetical protein
MASFYPNRPSPVRVALKLQPSQGTEVGRQADRADFVALRASTSANARGSPSTRTRSTYLRASASLVKGIWPTSSSSSAKGTADVDGEIKNKLGPDDFFGEIGVLEAQCVARRA